MQYDIFISYRRDGGDMMAHILYERLTQKGYSVFQDVESLRSGKFNTAIYEKIEQCKDVILILPPNALDRCVDEDDWVRKEIIYALKNKKNIIPIMLRGFSWPEELPKEIADIRYLNGLEANTEYFDQFLVKLCDFFVTKKTVRSEEKKLKQKPLLRVALLLGVALIAILLPVIVVFVFKQSFGLIWRIIYFGVIVVIAKLILYSIETRPDIAGMCFRTLSEDDLKNTPEVVFSRLVSEFGKDIFIKKINKSPFSDLYLLKRLAFGTWDGKRTNYLALQFRRKAEWYDPSVFHLHALSKNSEAVKMLTRQGFVLQSTPDFLEAGVDYLEKDMFHVFLFYKKRKLDKIQIFQCDAKEVATMYDCIDEVLKNEKIF